MQSEQLSVIFSQLKNQDEVEQVRTYIELVFGKDNNIKYIHAINSIHDPGFDFLL